MVVDLASKTTLIKQIITDELPSNRIILSSLCLTHATEKVAKKVCYLVELSEQRRIHTGSYWEKSEDKASLKSKHASFLLVKHLKQLLNTTDETKREYYVCVISL